MYPILHIFGLEIETYVLWIAAGIVAAVLVFIKICQKQKIDNKVINFYLNVLIVAIVAGFLSAILFQSIYHWIESGKFELDGLTFLGGLIGGVAVFFLVFFLFAKEKHKAVFLPVCCNILTCIALAHCFGRIGCFFAGCCYGRETTSWLGVVFYGQTVKRLPTQLFEAIFLLALFFALLLKFRSKAYYVYPIAYGVWRFILEFFRDDPRGTFVPGITPSQFQSILLVLVGVGLIVFTIVSRKRQKRQAESGGTPDKNE